MELILILHTAFRHWKLTVLLANTMEYQTHSMIHEAKSSYHQKYYKISFIFIHFYYFKVFNASNVTLITRTRTEHMTEKDKEKMKKTAKTPLDSFLGIAEQQEKEQGAGTNGVNIYIIFFRNSSQLDHLKLSLTMINACYTIHLP